MEFTFLGGKYSGNPMQSRYSWINHMANSIQTYNRRFQIINDIDLLVLLHLVIKNIHSVPKNTLVENKLISFLSDICTNYGPGVINIDFKILYEHNLINQVFFPTLLKVKDYIGKNQMELLDIQIKQSWLTHGVTVFDFNYVNVDIVIEKIFSLLES